MFSFARFYCVSHTQVIKSSHIQKLFHAILSHAVNWILEHVCCHMLSFVSYYRILFSNVFLQIHQSPWNMDQFLKKEVAYF